MGEQAGEALKRWAEAEESRRAQVRGLEVVEAYLGAELERIRGMLAEATGQLNATIGARQALEELLGGGEDPSPPAPLPQGERGEEAAGPEFIKAPPFRETLAAIEAEKAAEEAGS